MSDEVQDVVEEVQTEAAPVSEQDKEPVPPSEETVKSEDEETKQPEAKPEKTFTQKELDEILTRRLAKEQRKIERFARAEAENQYLREQLQAKAPQVEQSSGEPKPEQFKTYEEYIDKLTDWKLDQRMAKLQEKTVAERQAQAQSEQEAKIRANLSKAAEKYDDFEDVVSNPSLPITPVMRDAIGESELAGDIAYYLGSNLKEAAEIAKMSNVQQVKAIDRIEAKLSAPKPVSKAPEPIEPVGKGRVKSEPDLSKMSVSEYAEYRAKNGARWAR